MHDDQQRRWWLFWAADGAGCCLSQVLVGCFSTIAFGAAAALIALFAISCGGDETEWEGPEYPRPSPGPPYATAVTTSEFKGDEHCGWEDVRFLAVPVEEVPASPEDYSAFVFVRDPEGAVDDQSRSLHGTLELKANLPPDAVKSPYTRGTTELWFSPSEGGRSAYVVDGDRVERWPRFDGGCD